jgi:phosphoribosylanthranilate isomerase
MSIRIKICGITRSEDALAAVQLGVDALGFIFYRKSPRYIAPSAAAAIIAKLPPFVSRVGVFVNEDPDTMVGIAREACLDTLQLHGSESTDVCDILPYPVVKVFGLRPDLNVDDLNRYNVSGFLLDTWKNGLKGGTGIAGDWEVAKKITDRCKKVILAGGLGPSNLEEAISSVLPYGVDLNSGVEIMPGVKNPHKMREAVSIVRKWKPTFK